MRRIIPLLLCAALMLSMTACGSGTPTMNGQFYYRRAVTEFEGTDGVIAPESRSVTSPLSDPDALFRSYFAGPLEDGLIAPFPRDSEVLDWQMENDTLTLTMNDSFGALSGVELSIACACICRTLTGLLPVTQVQLQLTEGTLGGKESLLLSPDSFMLYDNGLDQSRQEFTVYYTDSQRRYLIAEEIMVNLATEDDVIACLVEALMNPPENSGLYSTLPRRTKLLDYSVDNGICTINFSSELERNGFSDCEAQRLTLLSVVNTLTQMEEIQQVEFAAEGNLLVSYKTLTISEPFVFDENVIGPVRTGMNEFDVTLYLSNGTEELLAAVPTRVRHSSGISQPEQVIQALLNYPPANSLFSTIPAGTRVHGVTVSDGVCHVDLSEEFLSNETHLIRSVRSIVASVCSLDGIIGVQITVEGQTPGGSSAHLFGVLSPQSFWFL